MQVGDNPDVEKYFWKNFTKEIVITRKWFAIDRQIRNIRLKYLPLQFIENISFQFVLLKQTNGVTTEHLKILWLDHLHESFVSTQWGEWRTLQTKLITENDAF